MISYLESKVGTEIVNRIYLHYVKSQIPRVSTFQKSHDQTKDHFSERYGRFLPNLEGKYALW